MRDVALTDMALDNRDLLARQPNMMGVGDIAAAPQNLNARLCIIYYGRVHILSLICDFLDKLLLFMYTIGRSICLFLVSFFTTSSRFHANIPFLYLKDLISNFFFPHMTKFMSNFYSQTKYGLILGSLSISIPNYKFLQSRLIHN